MTDHTPGPRLPTTLSDWDHRRFFRDVDHPTILELGKRRTGKSFCADWLLYLRRKRFGRGLVFCETKFKGVWQKRFPEAMIFSAYNPLVMAAFLRAQTEPNAPDAFVLFDDVVGVSTDAMRTDSSLKQVMTMGRHFKITSVFAIQYAYAVPPTVRSNFDLIFVFKQNQKNSVKAIYEEWMSMVPGIESLNDAAVVINQYTARCGEDGQGRGILVIDTATESMEGGTLLFKWCAQRAPKYVLLPKKMWPGGEYPDGHESE